MDSLFRSMMSLSISRRGCRVRFILFNSLACYWSYWDWIHVEYLVGFGVGKRPFSAVASIAEQVL